MYRTGSVQGDSVGRAPGFGHGWVDYNFGDSTVCPVLLGQKGICGRTGCIVGQDGGTSQI